MYKVAVLILAVCWTLQGQALENTLTSIFSTHRSCDPAKVDECFSNPELWREPFVFDNSTIEQVKEVVILVHGFTDSPYTFRHFLPFFLERGLPVVALRLHGHAPYLNVLDNNNQLLSNTKKEDWDHQIQTVVKELEENGYKINLVGYSLGGLLSVRGTIFNSKAIKRLVVLAPALSIRSPIPFLYSGLSCLMPDMNVQKKHILGEINSYVADEVIPTAASCELSKLAYKTKQDIKKNSRDKKYFNTPVYAAFANKDRQIRNKFSLKWIQASFIKVHIYESGTRENPVSHTGLVYPITAPFSQNADKNFYFDDMLTDLGNWWDSSL
jgi:alpha-beta hydrolase superfamily lysophospholipase